MKTTRLIGVSAVTIGALALAACGSSSSGTSAGATTGGSASEGKTITLMVGVKGDPFYVSMECGAQEAAAAAGAKLDVQGPDKFDATLQNPMLDAVAATKPDALLVAPNDVTASTPPLKRIQDAGTKVVLVDTQVDDTTIGVSRIATNNELGGEKAAEALQTLGVKAGAKVLIISMNPGISTTDARDNGFRKKATELGYKLVSETQYSNNEASKAASIISAALAKDPDLAGVFASNLFTAQGVATGVKQAGKSATRQGRRVRRGPGPDQAARGRRRSGARRPEAVRHRPPGCRAGDRRDQRRVRDPVDRDRVAGRHQGQHVRPRRLQVHLQVLLLSCAGCVRTASPTAVRTHPTNRGSAHR